MKTFKNGYECLLGGDYAYPSNFEYDGRVLTVIMSSGTGSDHREVKITFEPRWFAVSDGSDRFPEPPYYKNPIEKLGLQRLKEWSDRDGFEILLYHFNHFDHDLKVICIKQPIVEEILLTKLAKNA